MLFLADDIKIWIPNIDQKLFDSDKLKEFDFAFDLVPGNRRAFYFDLFCQLRFYKQTNCSLTKNEWKNSWDSFVCAFVASPNKFFEKLIGVREVYDKKPIGKRLKVHRLSILNQVPCAVFDVKCPQCKEMKLKSRSTHNSPELCSAMHDLQRELEKNREYTLMKYMKEKKDREGDKMCRLEVEVAKIDRVATSKKVELTKTKNHFMIATSKAIDAMDGWKKFLAKDMVDLAKLTASKQAPTPNHDLEYYESLHAFANNTENKVETIEELKKQVEDLKAQLASVTNKP